MMISPCNAYSCIANLRGGQISYLVISMLLALLLVPGAVCGADAEKPQEATPIEITADNLLTDNTARRAEFTGNVHAVQGETQIWANRLVLFYGANTQKTAAVTGSAIERMEAYGKVRIAFDNRVAVSDKAVYITKERKLVLEGPGSKVTRGKDQIEGTKITFFRNDGTVALEGSADKQVKVTIHSEQMGLN